MNIWPHCWFVQHTTEGQTNTTLRARGLPREDRGLPTVPCSVLRWESHMCCSSGGKARKASVLVTQQSAGPQSPPSAVGKPEAAQLRWEGKDVLPLAKVGSGEGASRPLLGETCHLPARMAHEPCRHWPCSSLNLPPPRLTHHHPTLPNVNSYVRVHLPLSYSQLITRWRIPENKPCMKWNKKYS